jgi:hypothetical protein
MSQYIKIRDHIIHLPSIKHACLGYEVGYCIHIDFKEGGSTDISFLYDLDERAAAFQLLEEALMNLNEERR